MGLALLPSDEPGFLSTLDQECVRVRMLFELKGIEVLERLEEAGLLSIKARMQAYMVC